MTQYMDAVGSLRKVAHELLEIDVNDPAAVTRYINGASFMIRWIADGIERQLELAQRRGRKELNG